MPFHGTITTSPGKLTLLANSGGNSGTIIHSQYVLLCATNRLRQVFYNQVVRSYCPVTDRDCDITCYYGVLPLLLSNLCTRYSHLALLVLSLNCRRGGG